LRKDVSNFERRAAIDELDDVIAEHPASRG
jgi:hypothetical protein